MSDWGAVHDTLKAALAGCDLEMPGPGQYFATSRIMSEIRKGTISKTIIDDKVRRILYVKFYLGLFDSPGKRGPGEANTKKHQDLCREVAENGMVLLKNSGNILPLNINTVKSIAVIGPNAKNLPLDGGGSSEVLAPYLVSPEMGLRDKCGEKVVVKYATGCTLPYDWKEVSVKGNAPNKTAKIRIRCMSSGMATGNGNSYIWFDNGSLSSPQGSIEIKNNSFEKWTEDWVKTGNVKDNGVFDWHKIDKARSYGMGNDQGPANASGEISQVIDVNGKVKRGDLCTFKMWAKPEKLYTGKANLQIEFLSAGGTVLGSSTSGEIKINEGYDDESIAEAVETAKKCDYAVVFIGLNGNQEGEGKDKENMLLPPGQDILVDAIYRANKKTIIVLMSGTPVDMQKWVDQVPGIVYAFYTGQEGGNAIANLLFGDVNPSGKLPFTMPKKLEDNPSYGNYPGSGGKVEYAEGIFVGYRFYDTKKVDPLFPFGYGLSYTSFKYANLQVTPEKMDSAGTITVSLDLENSGSVEGKEVVQLYIRDLESSLERPLRELKEFQKINLKPGEKKKIIFKLKKDALSFYDSAKKSWVAEPGLFEVQIGSSSRDIRLTKTFELLK